MAGDAEFLRRLLIRAALAFAWYGIAYWPRRAWRAIKTGRRAADTARRP